MKTLYLVRGVPGAGKSTFARDICFDAVHIEADMYFLDDTGKYCFDAALLHDAHKWCQKATEFALNSGVSVVVSNTSTTEKEVHTYAEIARRAGATFFSVIVENRHGSENVHNVPEETIAKMKNRFSVKL